MNKHTQTRHPSVVRGICIILVRFEKQGNIRRRRKTLVIVISRANTYAHIFTHAQAKQKHKQSALTSDRHL